LGGERARFTAWARGAQRRDMAATADFVDGGRIRLKLNVGDIDGSRAR